MFLLDTNVVSELRKTRNGTCNKGVMKWQSITDPLDCYLSVITIFEIQYGILNLRRRDSQQAKVLEYWFEHQVLTHFRHRIIGIDLKIAAACAALHISDKKPERDAFIAATALDSQLTLVTRNIKDFSNMDIDMINPCS